MPKVRIWEKKVAWIVSVSLAVIVIVNASLTLSGSALFDEYVLLAVVIAVFPSAVLDYVDYRWKRSVDEHLPDLFQSIVQAQESGMALTQAIEETSKRRYGALTEELKKMSSQMSWGMSFEEALQSFSKRVDTKLTRQAVPLIIEASHSGGEVERIFEPLGRFVESTLMAEKERRAQTRPYIAIVYVAFFVFLFTIIMLFKTFFIQMGELSVLQFALLSPEETRRLFFHMSFMQALFGGLVAGKMGEGTMSGGLKHSVILLLAGYLSLKFFV
ncbi:MAG: type II secretion system F family protein [Candidatus Bathyarchaeota archaeon]|jgi:flagellar protein FlaJ